MINQPWTKDVPKSHNPTFNATIIFPKYIRDISHDYTRLLRSEHVFDEKKQALMY